jgi:hypothetical protein
MGFIAPGKGGGSGGGVSLLEVVSYAPTTFTQKAFPTSFAALDTTDLTIPFTTTASGKGSTQVLVRLSGNYEFSSGVSGYIGLLLHGGGGQIGYTSSLFEAGASGPYVHVSVPILISSLTPSTDYQFDWGAVASSATSIYLDCYGSETPADNAGPAIMEVWAA